VYLIDCLCLLYKIFSPQYVLLVYFYVFISSILLPMTSFPWVPDDFFSLLSIKCYLLILLELFFMYLSLYLVYQWLIFHEYLIIVGLIYCFAVQRYNSYFLWVSVSCIFSHPLSNFLGFLLNVCIQGLFCSCLPMTSVEWVPVDFLLLAYFSIIDSFKSFWGFGRGPTISGLIFIDFFGC
jgi:hypothetical protein